jgi:hypothetical protein
VATVVAKHLEVLLGKQFKIEVDTDSIELGIDSTGLELIACSLFFMGEATDLWTKLVRQEGPWVKGRWWKL